MPEPVKKAGRCTHSTTFEEVTTPHYHIKIEQFTVYCVKPQTFNISIILFLNHMFGYSKEISKKVYST